MKRTLAFVSLLVVVAITGACSTDQNTNVNNANIAPKNGVVETNANVSRNLNSNTVPSNVGVVTNNNGNKNTAGVSSTNGNKTGTAGKNINGKP